MDSLDLEVLQKLQQWQQAGHSATLATVVKTWGSSPRPIGSLLAIRGDGQLAGSVSGGCIEADLLERIHTEMPARPEMLVYGGTAEDCHRFSLPCGGTLHILLEPAPPAPLLQTILEAITQRKPIGRRLHIQTSESALYTPQADETTIFDGQTLSTVHSPRWRLLLIGAGQISRYLAQIAQTLDYQIQICDPREEYRASWDVANAELLSGMPDDIVKAFNPDTQSAVLALTHDLKLDDLALLEALKSPAFYIGALGSRANNMKRRERLRLFDLSETEISRLHGPVGLPIGSRTPPEIAISILAELTAIRHGIELHITSTPPIKTQIQPLCTAT
ncbi:XdhC family protein [Sulfurirhabdus autotrophica]|uniref:Putative sulfurylase large subunit (Molybdopterin cytosine dinucleotide biosynthesis) /predicted sulfurylase small subunit (Molybdopterin cytosine dinucleotide biosynthesis) n=1 Tax=Sulfurirhabdus autotrophica TaxID=1706046 RepID=A0A4R3YF06_9PROT|nr:XdhC family protein [Sulfurirhabdus autotrophica]TCV90541.1 putative sulfurylase large subunit (molybdopterin cytosine dinucleotide biosynthesis) /predicted sulfurylase small subunit (molybdopterin cytosine dinucleotide biosynthesis) [Sulfurirhabdus autotrophica]